ncbi:ATP-binding cassette domain-containing protein [Dechloromonas denitrificans]|uniref:ATP-binding cassette domain-containing protein n=1 Tax=Dechloromonas denitrificans TaxID=281362 RepID=UPI00299F1F77|nr:ATP-binding cassette domain-containing protein [Dechloromonas denitrificans]UCV03895.1 ATP-binding cassette domain-containing protein [Dechloromonas denitrificans]UCV08151.1 ATP-binding cassette domain-containing protein [Dechloromonas denitrificans]
MEALRIISEDHRNLWRIVATIDLVADEMAAGSKVDPAFFSSIFDYIEQFMDACHHAKEDDHLFPLLRARSADAAAILDRLQAEHRNGPEVLKSLRGKLAETAAGQLGNAEFAAALRTYTESLKNHIRTEEKDAMPLAREVLTAEDWAQIDRAFLDGEDPLFGEKAKAEFRELFHRIASLAPESIGLGGQSAGELQPGVGVPGGDVLLAVSGMESCYGRIKALKGIDFEVRRGETIALVGANGAGKTTFLRTLSGVQPMSGGTIRFAGEDISKLRSDMRMRQGICQSPEGRQVFGPLSIEDNLRLGAYTQPKGQVAEDMEKIFAMFPILKEKRALPAGTLSGGQQQMLAIGRALMGRPKLLLLDEPSMGLAPLLVQEVFNVVKTLKAQGMTIILAEQNAFAALAIADRGYVLETGHITLTGTGQELISNEQVRAAYLGM